MLDETMPFVDLKINPVSGDFCPLLKAFRINLDTGQDRKNVARSVSEVINILKANIQCPGPDAFILIYISYDFVACKMVRHWPSLNVISHYNIVEHLNLSRDM